MDETITGLILLGIILIILVGLSALFSFSEMAISSANKTKLLAIQHNKDSSKRDKRQAKRVLHFIDNYNEHLTAIVIFNNIVNILFTTLATIFFINLATLAKISDDPSSVGPIMSFLIMTPIVIIFGEITPKQLAKRFSEIGTMRLSWTLQIINLIMKPITFILSKIIKEKDNTVLASDAEINLAISQATNAGVTSRFEQNLIKKLLEVDDKKISDAMIKKENVAVLNFKLNIRDLNLTLKDKSYTRYPVINEKEEVVSIFSSKKYLIERTLNSDIEFKNYQYGFTKYNEFDNPYHVFEDLRSKREKMGIVINEKNNFVGIITIEDIIELMLGGIYDENDIEKDGVYDLDNSSYILMPMVKIGYWINNYEKNIEIPSLYKTLTIEQWVKELAGNIEIKIDQNYTYKNIIIWTKEDNYEKGKIIYEIDVIWNKA